MLSIVYDGLSQLRYHLCKRSRNLYNYMLTLFSGFSMSHSKAKLLDTPLLVIFSFLATLVASFCKPSKFPPSFLRAETVATMQKKKKKEVPDVTTQTLLSTTEEKQKDAQDQNHLALIKIRMR